LSRPRPKLSISHIKRPTIETKFHIDYGWWEESNLDLKTYVYSRLSISDDAPLDASVEHVDLVDPETGEVRRVDGFQYALQVYLSQLPDDFTRQTSLVDAVFYVLLANVNRPMTPIELAEYVDRDPETVLKTISGPRIYQGIRPIFEDDE
jgi:hypothetical protein